MSPQMRLWIVSALAVGLSVAMGFGLAEANYTLATLLAAITLWIVGEWIGGPLQDAWILALVLAGYIVGNRGFAQMSLSNLLPLLPGEGALLVCSLALILRGAFKKVPVVTMDGLNLAILIWILLTLGRLPLDLSRHGWLALRDFATVYYASFFFIAQALSRHEASRLALHRALAVALAALPFVSAAFIFAPDFFINSLTVRGVPLIYLKGDIAAAYLAGGFFFFWAEYETTRRRWWLAPSALCLMMSPNVGSPRSAMVGTVMVTVLWIAARRWRLLGFQISLATLAIAAALPVLAWMNKDFKDTPFYSVYEHAVSIVDWEGRGTYRHAESGDPGDNNRFRLVWWRSVTEETLATNPAFGLGFGADLAAQFIVEYNLLEAEDFSARSPHSVIMTMFGRTGFVGLLSFLAIAVMMVRYTWPVFQLQDFPAMGLWSIAWVLWFSACFGVVLEGPMGAVVFWTVLGLAHEATCRRRQTSLEAALADDPAHDAPGQQP